MNQQHYGQSLEAQKGLQYIVALLTQSIPKWARSGIQELKLHGSR